MARDGICADEIYSALMDDEAFERLPTRLAQSFNARSTVIHWSYRDGSLAVLANSREPGDGWPGSFQPGDDPGRFMGIRIENAHGKGTIAIRRGKRQQCYEPELAGKLSEATVHLQRLLAVRGKFAALQRQAKAFESMLDFMPQAVLVLDSQRMLQFANSAARTLLAQGDALIIKGKRVSAVARNSARLLKLAVETACTQSQPRSSAVLLEREWGKPLPATAIPLRLTGCQALVMLQDPARCSNALAGQLQALFGLTAAEATIATRLSDGVPLRDIAAERKVSLATVRVQLKALSQKMDCNRQSEIVSLIKRIVPDPR